VSHSILGALTYDVVLTLVACRFVVRPLLAWLDRVRPSLLWNRFGGLDYREPKPRTWTIMSAAIGTLSHPLIDLPFHTVTTLFFPGPRVRLLTEDYSFLIGTLSALIFGPAFVVMLYEYWWRPSRRNVPVRRDASQ
jgi:hypothetical protein